jgi:hypothetical protein
MSVTEQSESAIRAAVQDCLARCYRGNTPLGVLAECLSDLRQKDWAEADIRKVETSVRKVLAGVVSEDQSE